MPEYNGPDWYASPQGSADNNGSVVYPWDLQTALNKTASILPGQTLWLRGGTYLGEFSSTLAGETDNRVVVRPYPDETPIIDGGLAINGEWVKFWVPRIINSTVYRGVITDPDGSNTRPIGLDIYAPNSIFIGGKILDSGVSVGYWSGASNSIVYGVLALNGGWVNDPGGTGHGTYVQNNTDSKLIKHCIFAPHFGRTLVCYGKGSGISGVYMDENVWIERSGDEALGNDGKESNLLIGGHSDTPLDDIEFTDNHVVGHITCQFLDVQSGALTLTGNKIWAREETTVLVVGYWETPTITGNVINGKSNTGDEVIKEMVRFTPPADDSGAVYTWNTNEYHYLGSEVDMFRVDDPDAARYDFTEWQATTGFDAASSYDEVDTLPDSATVWPNEYKDEYDKRCGIVVIWNGSGLDSVDVDLTSLSLVSGSSYSLIQVLDPLLDITNFVYNVGTLSVDMRAISHTLANPIGWDTPLTQETFPRFGCFLVEEV